MTGLDGSGDDPAGGPGDDAMALALQIADAVDGLTTLWSIAAQEARMRLSPHQLRALQILRAAPGLNLTTLAESMDIGMPTASRLCDRLEAAGLLERVLHPLKRREVQLNLTGHGQQVLDEVASRRTRALAEALAGMETDEREALARGMRGFLQAQDGLLPGADRPYAP
ncbi:MarR family transcriptional regulator [Streptomyces sp. JB150]|uniref:MarR family winged helix-turn-helix transcriptional regulator n=1 Tax=Streptomyces sp. JB150 TaxID=2714844 RepID=UPI00140BC8E5|nr:MarR family transcriptional regulator [Streptomyces sp. JB150]QIJ61215.1 MarR family transcriptional regulator [Streptomyces sp. JB150]